jgi:hypothetical protein
MPQNYTVWVSLQNVHAWAQKGTTTSNFITDKTMHERLAVADKYLVREIDGFILIHHQ